MKYQLVLASPDGFDAVTDLIQTTLSKHVGEFCHLSFSCQEQQVLCTHNSGWLTGPTPDNNSNPPHDCWPLADVLQDIADTLPFTGNILDFVFVVQGQCIGESYFTLLVGALRRLKDWHNANITVLHVSPGTVIKSQGNGDQESMDTNPVTMDMTDLLQKFIGVSVLHSMAAFHQIHTSVWRGKCAIVDKTVNRGFILPGFQLDMHSNTCTGVPFPAKHTAKLETTAILGRMLEVLDEVTLATIPKFMFKGLKFKLSLYDNHPHSKAFLEEMSSLETGLVIRLACYPQSSVIPPCREKYLNTDSWKESVLADITYVQEPEEEVLDTHEYIYFVVTADKENLNYVTAHLLRSPSELNGKIIADLHDQSLLPRKPSSIRQDYIAKQLSHIPCLSMETLDWLNRTVKEIQLKILKEWLDSQKVNQVEVSPGDILKLLTDVQSLVMEKLAPHFSTVSLKPATALDYSAFRTELDACPSEWPEKHSLIHHECQRKGLSRIQSTESLALSSPIQAKEDIPSTIDIKNFTILFKEDGTAASDNLSPVRRKQSSRTGGSLLTSLDRRVSTDLSWPECKDLRAPDVYYNRNKKCERIADQCNKIRDRYVTEETYSSCSSPVFFVNKNVNKKRKSAEESHLRRSPRKSISKYTSPSHKGNRSKLKSPQKSKGNILKSPLKQVSMQLKSPRRAHTTKQQVVPGEFQRHRLHSTNVGSSDVRRSPRKKVSEQFTRVMQSKERRQSLPVPSKGQDLRQTSSRRLSAVERPEGKSKESRSERHKRKLEEIVSDVLHQHGIGPDDVIHGPCVQRLYKVTKLFVMDLPTSQNLKQEMRDIAEGQVKQVVDLERKRHSK